MFYDFIFLCHPYTQLSFVFKSLFVVRVLVTVYQILSRKSVLLIFVLGEHSVTGF